MNQQAFVAGLVVSTAQTDRLKACRFFLDRAHEYVEETLETELPAAVEASILLGKAGRWMVNRRLLEVALIRKPISYEMRLFIS